MNKQPSVLSFIAWSLVGFMVVAATGALMTQLLWNVVTSPVLGVDRISLRTALAALLTTSTAMAVVDFAFRRLLGIGR